MSEEVKKEAISEEAKEIKNVPEFKAEVKEERKKKKLKVFPLILTTKNCRKK